MKDTGVTDYKIFGIQPSVPLQELRDVVAKHGGFVLDRHTNGEDGCHNVFIRCDLIEAVKIIDSLRGLAHGRRFRSEKCKGGYRYAKMRTNSSRAVKVTVSDLGRNPDEEDLLFMVKDIYETLRSVGMPPRACCHWTYHCKENHHSGEILMDVGDVDWASFCCLTNAPNNPVFDAKELSVGPARKVVYLHSFQPSQKPRVFEGKNQSTRIYIPKADQIVRNNVYDMRKNLPFVHFSPAPASMPLASATP